MTGLTEALHNCHFFADYPDTPTSQEGSENFHLKSVSMFSGRFLTERKVRKYSW